MIKFSQELLTHEKYLDLMEKAYATLKDVFCEETLKKSFTENSKPLNEKSFLCIAKECDSIVGGLRINILDSGRYYVYGICGKRPNVLKDLFKFTIEGMEKRGFFELEGVVDPKRFRFYNMLLKKIKHSTKINLKVES